MFKILAIVACLVAVDALEPYGHSQGGATGGGHHEDYYTEPHYSFYYEVKDLHTHDIKSHKEERKGDHTQGVYELVEPDGSKRRVEYHVEGKSGFNAVVHREHTKHPVSSHKGGYSNEYSGSSSGGYSGEYGKKGGEASSYASLSTKGSLGGQGGAYKIHSEGGYGGQHALLLNADGHSSGGYESNAGLTDQSRYSHGAGKQSSLGGEYGGSGVATSYASYTSHGSVGEQGGAGYGQSAEHSLGGYESGSSGGASLGGYSSNGGYSYGAQSGAYKAQPISVGYQSGESGRTGYEGGYAMGSGHGDATSSVKFSTLGAKITTQTHHIIPQKHYQPSQY